MLTPIARVENGKNGPGLERYSMRINERLIACDKRIMAGRNVESRTTRPWNAFLSPKRVK